jgi:hypothetical protein
MTHNRLRTSHPLYIVEGGVCYTTGYAPPLLYMSCRGGVMTHNRLRTPPPLYSAPIKKLITYYLAGGQIIN